ncbi:hypothetical protein ASPZODRAFT_441892 [Penicilliopsis zonata CBS 506.65]|uniref:Transmembrane protein n=1 Tax=Penicilliopsis zonata CBS 506.65 TaxID=1073090 RepID=A0A1L9SWU7_9EURO|nr:hypothetical protein ASPZODRAFT_441892 [Penicilliopsis zonata CBS 506.65]OJJ51639.1 hypothetical protein ASPZODRAFT_441892 [Penicilliopsis zonata CBS 506.65]
MRWSSPAPSPSESIPRRRNFLLPFPHPQISPTLPEKSTRVSPFLFRFSVVCRSWVSFGVLGCLCSFPIALLSLYYIPSQALFFLVRLAALLCQQKNPQDLLSRSRSNRTKCRKLMVKWNTRKRSPSSKQSSLPMEITPKRSRRRRTMAEVGRPFHPR